jgi:cytochrome oxidase Cu insertion factor (SCO1/SenC/PrrC family)
MSRADRQSTMRKQSPGAGQVRWRKHLWWVLPLLAFALLIFGSWAIRLRANPTSAVQADATTQTAVAAEPTVDLPVAPVEGALAPDFTLDDLNGEEWTLSELRGRVVMLNFWATW